VLIPPLVLLNFFVAVVMVSVGLRTSSEDLLNILRDRALLTRMLVANCVLVPAIGFFLVQVFPLTVDARIGIMLLATIPGTPIAMQFTRLAKTKFAFAAALTFVLSLMSIVLTPLAIETMPDSLQRSQRPLVFLIASIALYIALPLCTGVWMVRHAPRLAPKLVLPFGLIASLAFFFLMWETRLVRRQAFHTMRGNGTVLAMFLLLVISMLIGWLIAGPNLETRRVVATSTGMRSVVVVLYIARYCFPNTYVYMIPIVYLSLMVPANLLFHLAFTGWYNLRPKEKT
jgi:bile acid:Na+ symporter, BASS family